MLHAWAIAQITFFESGEPRECSINVCNYISGALSAAMPIAKATKVMREHNATVCEVAMIFLNWPNVLLAHSANWYGGRFLRIICLCLTFQFHGIHIGAIVQAI